MCQLAAEVTGVSGAGILLVVGGVAYGSLGATDAIARLLGDLQWTLGEGPSFDAHREAIPVLEPDLQAPAYTRWPVFGAAAATVRVAGVFAFPLLAGGACLGVLDLYRDRPGPLGDEQHGAALVAADFAASALLGLQAGATPGRVAPEIVTDRGFLMSVHRAAGMISVQLGVSVPEALVRLRAFAFSTNRNVADVAEEIVTRKLRFNGPADIGPESPGAVRPQGA